MANRPSVLIYGHDGFDADVAINLRAMYEDIGFTVLQSRTLIPATILCVQRPSPEPIALPNSYSQIHVFDYLGRDASAMFSSLDEKGKLYVFTSSPARLERYRHGEVAPVGNIYLQLPPVAVSRWYRRRRQIRYSRVHIGNYKPYYTSGEDPFANGFLRALREHHVLVWGRGWRETIPRGNWKGRAPILNVSEIYARSGLALGMMYPFQRNETISGRYWHGPINGCPVLTEPNGCARGLPGVLEVDYSGDFREQSLVAYQESRADLQERATEFWTSHYRATTALFREIVGEVRLAAPPRARLRPSSRTIAVCRDRARVLTQALRIR